MLQPGDNIDIWVVEKALGSGGMGSVYRCHNRTANRILAAVKTLDSSLRKVTGAEERFIREAEILFRIDHPHIVKVRNVRTDSDPPYLEMEFVEGESLENKLERGPVPLHEALTWTEQLLDAVAYLHDQGIRHRDIKPANVLVTKDGRVKLVDFGLAMEADVTRITQTGMSFGTVSYAPPEWVYPEQIDPVRWDIYAIGVVLWEMLTGGVAFPVSGQGTARQQAMQVMLQKQKHDPMDPGPSFTERLRALTRRMTESDANNRPNNARACLAELKAVERNYERPVGQTLVAAEGAAPSLYDGSPKPRRPSVMAVSAPVIDPGPQPAQRKESNTWVEGATPHPAPIADPAKGTRPPPVPAAGVDAAVHDVDQPTAGFKVKKAPTPAPTNLEAADTLAGPRPVPVSTAPSSLPIMVGVSAIVLAILLLATVAVVAAVMLYSHGADRDVDVVVSGLPAGTPMTLSVSELLPSKQDGWVYTYRDVPVGKAPLVAVVGNDCPTTCATGGQCPAWCGVQIVEKDVAEGDDVLTLTLSVDPPALRPVTARVPDQPDLRPTIEVGGKAVTDLAPGPYDATLVAGDVRWNAKIVVPWGAAALALDVPAPPVPVKPEAKVEAKVETKRPDAKIESKVESKVDAKVEAKTTTPAGVGKLVTNGEFAKWLATHEEYQRDAAVASNVAGGTYLQGWTGAEPPAGQAGAVATNVSWYVAQNYCVSKGGDLPPKDAAPLTWQEIGGAPAFEWRVDGAKAVFHTSDGMDSPTKRADANALTGFRCMK